MHVDNPREKNMIKFETYFKKIFGKDNYELYISKISKKLKENLNDELELLFRLEAYRWYFIWNNYKMKVEINNDVKGLVSSKLNKTKFYSFLFYNEIDSVRLNDCKYIFQLYDLNGDKIIDYDEFSKAIQGNLFLGLGFRRVIDCKFFY